MHHSHRMITKEHMHTSKAQSSLCIDRYMNAWDSKPCCFTCKIDMPIEWQRHEYAVIFGALVSPVSP